MTGFYSPWPLFGDDLDQARSWIRPQLLGQVTPRAGHLAISLGLGDELLDRVREGELQANANALHQWRFRIARLHGEKNPYRHLVPENLIEQALEAVAQSNTTGHPVTVHLNGGVGDHLEALSLLLPWAVKHLCCLDLVMDAERQQLIEPLLPQVDGIRSIKSPEKDTAVIPVMALRAVVMGSAEPAHYQPWLPQKQSSQRKERQLLCCWRAEGAGDKMSAHSRSVPWALVQSLYENLQRQNPEIQIVDITSWTSWEAERLKQMGVAILDPRCGTLLHLAHHCRVSRVITIDTALVHLCAAAGQSADLLLSLFPDERWQELHRPEHNYGQLINQWRSSEFGSWSAVLASLSDSLASEV